MSCANLNIDLKDSNQYISILQSDKDIDSGVNFNKTDNGLKIEFHAETPKALLSLIGSTIRKIRVIENVSEISKN
ncbi:MAG: hypothetical protein ACP5M9_02270 [Candidatus Micrarchaeia archaeon]